MKTRSASTTPAPAEAQTAPPLNETLPAAMSTMTPMRSVTR